MFRRVLLLTALLAFAAGTAQAQVVKFLEFDQDGVLPSADPDIRARLEAEAAAEGWASLHRRLAAVDAAAAPRGTPQPRMRSRTGRAPWTAQVCR